MDVIEDDRQQIIEVRQGLDFINARLQYYRNMFAMVTVNSDIITALQFVKEDCEGLLVVKLDMYLRDKLDYDKISKWADNIRFVEYCKLNITKHELYPLDENIYCKGLDCEDCPYNSDGLPCNHKLSDQINFMKAVVARSEE